MIFCKNCGKNIDDSAVFCPYCGSKVNSTTPPPPERKTQYDGVIHKCPNCGEPMKSFTSNCPMCGYEVRGTKTTKCVEELHTKLNGATTNEQRIIIIKTFPVPNTKEDIFELMLLAHSNFDAAYYASHMDEEDISDAWLTKIEQCYQKAKLILNATELSTITSLYTGIKNTIQSESKKIKSNKTSAILFIAFGSLLTILPTVILQPVGIVLLIVGIIKLSGNKSKNNKAKNTNQNTNSGKTGFSSWSTTNKVLWIILNIYTVGIPAIIYACSKRN